MQEQQNSLQQKSLHIQLNSLEIRQKDMLQNTRKYQNNILLKVKAFPISISTYEAIAYFSLFGMWFIQLFSVYLAQYSKIFGKNDSQANAFTQQIISLSQYGWIFNGIIILLIVIPIVLLHFNQSLILSVVQELATKMHKYIRFGQEICLFTTNIFAFKINAQNISYFAVSCTLSILVTIFFQNMTLRKDQFCCKSLEFSIQFRVTLIVSLTLLIITYNMPASELLFILMFLFQFLLSIILLVSYFSFGLIIYRKKAARYSFFLIITSYFILNLAFLIDIFATLQYKYASPNIISIFLIIFLCSQFFFMSFYNRMKMNSQNPQNKDINKKIYFAFMTFEQLSEDIEIQCELRGIIKDHFDEGCDNLLCMANINEAYDAKKKKICMQNKIGQGISSIIKYYVNCLYQGGLKYSKDNNIHRKIDYLQFSFFKLRKTYQVLRKIQELKQVYLTYYQQIRLERLKESILQEVNNLNKNLYNSSLFLQQIIKSEQTFSTIQQLVIIVLKRNELLWKYLRSNEVFLKELLQIVQPNFSLISKIQQFWDEISNMFKINRKWNFYYTCFYLFVRNQKLNPSLIQEFGSCADLDSIFRNDNSFLDKSAQKNGIYKSSMLFQTTTCLLIAECDQEKTNIIKVSSYFQKNFDYSLEDLYNRPLSILMTPSVSRQHQKELYRWISEGKNHNQSLFQIKKIYPVTSQGFIRPAFKFYKMLVTLRGNVELVAMFKRNNKQQLIILASSDLKIQGVTESLCSKLKINYNEIEYLKGMPLLSIIPSIIRYSSFSSSIQEDDEDYGYYFNKSFKRQLSTVNPNNIENLSVSSTVQMWFPYKMDEALKVYEGIDQKNQLEKIRKFHQWLRNKQHSNKFSGGISLKKRFLGNEYYFQIQFNEVQFAQKLQKIDKENALQSIIQTISQRQVSQQARQSDLSLFLSLSRKKNKLLLFPSKNIFLKEQVNKLLPQISHINNISHIARFFVVIMIGSLLAQFIIQINHVGEFYSLTRQYSELVMYQKTIYMLNSQYNIQHLQPGNAWETSFFIIGYTHTLIHNYESPFFQSMIYDSNLNQPSLTSPENSILIYGSTKKFEQQTYDQYQIFFKMYECAIALHRLAQVQPQNTLDILQYYEFNDYAMPFYKLCEKTKNTIQRYFFIVLDQLSQQLIIFMVSISFLTVLFLMLAVANLNKAVKGFQQLVSIFVQIDNTDNMKISKYVDFTRSLFDFLNEKLLRTMNYDAANLTSSSAFRSIQKSSSQNIEEQGKRLQANLNKKIKKINIGYQIYYLIIKPFVILISTIVIIGVTMIALGLYSKVNFTNLEKYQKIGFEAFKFCGAHNIFMNAVLQKFRNASVYSIDKYSSFLEIDTIYNMVQNKLSLTLGDSELENFLKILYFDNFCQKLLPIFNQTLTSKFESICGDANAGWCIEVKPFINDKNFAQRCQNVEKHQLKKGLSNYMNYFLDQFLLYLHDSTQQNLTQIVEANDAFKFADIMFAYAINQWTVQLHRYIGEFEKYSIVITICSIFASILLVYFVIGKILTEQLNMCYQIFRKIHENYIPQWIINKQKIIKAKLIKQGFMKD